MVLKRYHGTFEEAEDFFPRNFNGSSDCEENQLNQKKNYTDLLPLGVSAQRSEKLLYLWFDTLLTEKEILLMHNYERQCFCSSQRVWDSVWMEKRWGEGL